MNTPAAIRTGNKSELSPVHELYLDWSSDPPRAPDDVMVLDDPNSIYDHLIDAEEEELSNNLPEQIASLKALHRTLRDRKKENAPGVYDIEGRSAIDR